MYFPDFYKRMMQRHNATTAETLLALPATPVKTSARVDTAAAAAPAAESATATVLAEDEDKDEDEDEEALHIIPRYKKGVSH